MVKVKPLTNNFDVQRELVDLNRRVRVYRNLHKGCWSVEQNGVVVFHCDRLGLSDCRFNVSKAGRERVRKEKKKNVHARISGYLSSYTYNGQGVSVSYNPYTHDTFMSEYNLPVLKSDYTRLNTFSKNPVMTWWYI